MSGGEGGLEHKRRTRYRRATGAAIDGGGTQGIRPGKGMDHKRIRIKTLILPEEPVLRRCNENNKEKRYGL